MRLKIASSALLFCLPLLSALPVFAADPSYWVTYQLDATVRTPPTTAWSPWYSGPFAVSMGYDGGSIFTDQTVTDPNLQNCFSFTVTPQTSHELVSIRQQVVVTAFHGNNLCSATDPNQVTTLAVIDMTVGQKQSNTFQLPFLGGRQIRIELSQTWAVPQNEAGPAR